MKAALLLLALAAPSTSAETIVCPAAYMGSRLLGAGMYTGERKEFELMGGRKEVRGGWDVDFGFNTGEVKWVACWYAVDKVIWHQVSLDAKRCDLRQRTTAKAGTTAAVTCK